MARSLADWNSISATGIKGTPAPTVFSAPGLAFYSLTLGNQVDLLGSARARFGWAPSSDWLLFGTGGLGWEHVNQTTSESEIFTTGGTFAANSSYPVNSFGWVLGAGVETRIMHSNWIGRLEYLHYDFGQARGSTGFNQVITTGVQTIDLARVALSYKLGN